MKNSAQLVAALVRSDQVRLAADVARRVHSGQRYGDQSYFEGHLLPVAGYALWYGVDDDGVTAALLHDAVEDTRETVGSLQDRGISPLASALVDALTFRPVDGVSKRQNRLDYYRKIVAGGSMAIKVKLADRRRNVEKSWETRDSRLFKYQQTYPDFRRILCEGLGDEVPFWDLDRLLGWKGA